MNLFLVYPSNTDDLKSEDAFSSFGLTYSPYDLLMCYLADLDALAEEYGVAVFSQFMGEEEDTQWFAPVEGLTTVDALIQGLPDSDVLDTDDLLEELRRLRQELETLQVAGRRFMFWLD